jgi:hypothetical protein
MRIPFERLVEQVAAVLSTADQDLPMGTLAARFEVSTDRLADAIDALKMLRGERTYIPYQGTGSADLASLRCFAADECRHDRRCPNWLHCESAESCPHALMP